MTSPPVGYSGTVRKLPSGRYQARITGPNGRTRYPAPVTFDRKRAAEAWLVKEGRRIQEDPDTWVPPKERLDNAKAEAVRREANRVTFASYAQQVLTARRTKGQSLQPATRLRYEGLLTKYVNPTFGSLALEDISPQVVAEWWAGLPDSPKTRKEAYVLAKSIMGEATGVHGPCSGGLNPFQIRGAGAGASPKRNTTVSKDELDVILATIRPEWRAMVLLALWCGMRFGELAALRRSDVDLASGVIRIRSAIGLAGRATKHVKAPKSEAGIRDQRIPAHVVPALRTHLASLVNGRDGLVFPSKAGEFLNPSVFYGKAKGSRAPVPGGWFAAREAAGRPDLHFHDLRATGATLWAQLGASIAEIQLFLGDSSPEAAMRYVRATSSRMDALTDRTGELAEEGDW